MSTPLSEIDEIHAPRSSTFPASLSPSSSPTPSPLDIPSSPSPTANNSTSN
ncbi:hypothetical protein DFP72DRAFT_1079034 [Ephemerocybe angulata]|uniref:Uncharacterized protein n=1 Tax=Ephemerocybe angulata TaxID=980116 RepID=A0A8H6LVD6_9AGAR|nr:hypothetical protein DFP72DRAFT_1079034 [Tulosesus angulatus]